MMALVAPAPWRVLLAAVALAMVIPMVLPFGTPGCKQAQGVRGNTDPDFPFRAWAETGQLLDLPGEPPHSITASALYSPEFKRCAHVHVWRRRRVLQR